MQVIFGKEGSRGSNVTTKTALLVFCCLNVQFRVCSLGIAFALAIAPLIIPGVYSLSKSISLSSLSLVSLEIKSLQALTILMHKLKGIDFVYSMGW